ncbi:hypothetical protein [Ilumatobacter sp.]|uniref:hypothetical protein n=1 Tax=Ilumatobacter sp. TaxID=1967498 RepID=UPI003B52C362
MIAQPAHRRFLNDLRDPRCIPAVDAAEIVALEAERVRLVEALEEAERGPSGNDLNEADYIQQRAHALRHGTELPSPPRTAAERQADADERRRNVAAASTALLEFGEVVCRTVEAHPEWRVEARDRIATAAAEAEAASAAARAAAQRAEEARWQLQHLERTARNELYPATYPSPLQNQDDLIWDINDPQVRDLMARSRTDAAI